MGRGGLGCESEATSRLHLRRRGCAASALDAFGFDLHDVRMRFLLLGIVRLVPHAASAIAVAACGGVAPSIADAGSDASSAAAGGCTSDSQCNTDPTISSLLGTCTNGACVCKTGIPRTVGGTCGAEDGSIPSDCEAKGGKCFGLGGGPPPPSNYRPATPDEATCGSYPGTQGGTDQGCFFLK